MKFKYILEASRIALDSLLVLSKILSDNFIIQLPKVLLEEDLSKNKR